MCRWRTSEPAANFAEHPNCLHNTSGQRAAPGTGAPCAGALAWASACQAQLVFRDRHEQRTLESKCHWAAPVQEVGDVLDESGWGKTFLTPGGPPSEVAARHRTDVSAGYDRRG